MISFPSQENNPTHICLIKNFLNSQEVDYFLNQLHHIPYETAGVMEEKKIVSSHRESKIKWVPHQDIFLPLYNKCASMIHSQNSYTWKFDLESSRENFQYTEYDSKVEGHYDWHVDLGTSHTSFRKLSLVIQLSDPNDYEGGDLRIFDPVVSDENFPYKDVPKGKGTAILFPSFIPHKVTPVTKGLRKSLVWWVGNSHFR